MAANPTTRLTAAEYRALPETQHHTELINGELIIYGADDMGPAPKDHHQETIVGLIFALSWYIPHREIRIAPADVYLDESNVVQPDIFWTRPSNEQCVVKDGYWHGAQDFIIEVLSPSTEQRGRGVKFDLYEKYGVGEYWLVHPDQDIQTVEVYVREGESLPDWACLD